MVTPEVFEDFAKKRLKKLIAEGEDFAIVASFIDVFGDSVLTECFLCGVPVWVRPYIFEASQEHDLKVACICCCPPLKIRGQIMMDFAKIEEEMETSNCELQDR